MFKKLLSFVGLGVFAITSAAAGVLLAQAPKASEAKADPAPKTWMFRAQLDLGEASPNYEGCVIDPSEAVEGAKLHYWGANVDAWVDAEYMFFSTYDFYAVNVALADDQTVEGMQWVITQKTLGDKYSADITDFGGEHYAELNKDTDYIAIEHQFANIWDGDKWTFTNAYGHGATALTITLAEGETYEAHYTLDPEPANNVFVARNFSLELQDTMSMEFDNPSVNIYHNAFALFDDDSESCITYAQPNWWWLHAGTFDLFLGNAKLSIRQYDNEIAEVYLVGIEPEAYIYSFGNYGGVAGVEEFGAFPGTKLSEILLAEDITGDLKFQGVANKIYSLCLHEGYPYADHFVISYVNEHGHVGNQTADLLLKNGSAYWWSDDDDYHNDDAGKALWFLEMAESYRTDATNESVCNISKANAAIIVDAYNNLSADIRSIYVDGTTVLTHKRDGSEGKEYVEYRYVMEELAKIAEVELVGASRPINTSGSVTITAIVGIIAIIAITSITAVFVVVTLKKKHE